jgi:predicted nucleic acid-binding protein
VRGVPDQELVSPGGAFACRHRNLSSAADPQRRGRAGLAAEFCAAIADDELRVIEVTPHDYRRMAELLTTYSSLRLQAVDACVIALAERLELHEVAALDHRDFQIVAPRSSDC